MAVEPFQQASVTRARMSPVSTSRSFCDGRMLKRAAEPEGPAIRGGWLSTQAAIVFYKMFVSVDLSTPHDLPNSGVLQAAL